MTPYEKKILNILLKYRQIHRKENLTKRHWRYLVKDVLDASRPSTEAMDNILKHVSSFTGVSIAQMQCKCRKREYAEVRQVACFILRRTTKISTSMIGVMLGNRDHATVLHSVKTIYNLLENSASFREKYTPLLAAYGINVKTK